MKSSDASVETLHLPALRQMPLPIKALISTTLLDFGFASIPTFFEPHNEDGRATRPVMDASQHPRPEPGGHGDLIGQVPAQAAETPEQQFYKSDQFLWTLKWTHIHLFGMKHDPHFNGTDHLAAESIPECKDMVDCLSLLWAYSSDVGAVWLKGMCRRCFSGSIYPPD